MVYLSIFWLEFSSSFGEKEAHVRRIVYSCLVYWTFTYMGWHFQTAYRFLVNGQWFWISFHIWNSSRTDQLILLHTKFPTKKFTYFPTNSPHSHLPSQYICKKKKKACVARLFLSTYIKASNPYKDDISKLQTVD